MAKVIGLDIGTTGVRVVHYGASKNDGVYIENAFERRFQRAHDGVVDAAELTSALISLNEEGAFNGEDIRTGINGARCSLKELRFPYRNKKQIEQTLGFELEDVLPFALEELAYSWRIAEEQGVVDGFNIRAEGSNESANQETLVRALVAPRNILEERLSLLDEHKIQTRGLYMDALALSELNKLSESDTPSFTADGIRSGILFLDLGAQSTNVSICSGGEALFAQTLRLGGDDVTRAIAKALSLSFADAELFKLDNTFLEVDTRKAQFPNEVQASDAAKRSIDTLVERLRQMVLRCRDMDIAVSSVQMSGGASELTNLEVYLSKALGVSVSKDSHVTRLLNGAAASSALLKSAPRFAQATAYALCALGENTASESYNLRRGRYAFKGEYDFVKERIPPILAWLCVAFVLFTGAGFFKVSQLKQQHADLNERVLERCAQILGERVETTGACKSLMAEQIDGSKGFRFPKYSAVDVYLGVIRAFPDFSEDESLDSSDDTKSGAKKEKAVDETTKSLDAEKNSKGIYRKVNELVIQKDTLRLKGRVRSVDGVEVIEQALKEAPCLVDVEKDGRTRSVKEEWEFVFTAKIDCVANPGVIEEDIAQDTMEQKKSKKNKNVKPSKKAKSALATRRAKPAPTPKDLDVNNEGELQNKAQEEEKTRPATTVGGVTGQAPGFQEAASERTKTLAADRLKNKMLPKLRPSIVRPGARKIPILEADPELGKVPPMPDAAIGSDAGEIGVPNIEGAESAGEDEEAEEGASPNSEIVEANDAEVEANETDAEDLPVVP